MLGTLIAVGLALLAGFVIWEQRSQQPMLPMRFFRSRAFSATNGVSLAMYFGVFGSIFLLAQFFQIAQHYSPLEAGMRTLPWTAMPIFVAPLAGLLSDRIGGPAADVDRPEPAGGGAGLARDDPRPGHGLRQVVVPFIMAGTGMALVFAPAANAVLSSVRPSEAGQASGATNAIREVGGVLGDRRAGHGVLQRGLASSSPQAFSDGLQPARSGRRGGAGAAARCAALLVPGKERAQAPRPAAAAV